MGTDLHTLLFHCTLVVYVFSVFSRFAFLFLRHTFPSICTSPFSPTLKSVCFRKCSQKNRYWMVSSMAMALIRKLLAEGMGVGGIGKWQRSKCSLPSSHRRRKRGSILWNLFHTFFPFVNHTHDGKEKLISFSTPWLFPFWMMRIKHTASNKRAFQWRIKPIHYFLI